MNADKGLIAPREIGRLTKLWLLSLGVGIASGYAVIVFRAAIDGVAHLFFGSNEATIASAAADLPAGRVLVAPIFGGLIVSGLLLFGRKFGWLPKHRSEGVADIIEARAVNQGRMRERPGPTSAAIAAVSLGSGASAGREGPAVHFGAAVAATVARLFGLNPFDSRILLGCGAAAAVTASFNAPIAGILFAFEVILGNYALRVFGPVTLASVAATVVTRLHLGDYSAFEIPPYAIVAFAELPANFLLGAVCGAVAALFMATTRTMTTLVEKFCRKTNFSPDLTPPIAGLGVGVMGVAMPEILSVGYETTDHALNGRLAVSAMVLFLFAKILATALTLSCRFGGGVFGPALYIGAMIGGAYGVGMNALFPATAADPGFYAAVGMGATAGAVLGAPISTALIVFELTGGYQMAIALLLAVSAANLTSQLLFGKSFFHWQLARAGYDLSDGPHGIILKTLRVRDAMERMPEATTPLSADAPYLTIELALEEALARIAAEETDGLPVARVEGENAFAIGYMSREKALATYNEALIQSHIELHR